MRHKLTNIFLAVVLIATLITSLFVASPVLADSSKDKKHPSVIGQEVQVDKYIRVKKLRDNYEGNKIVSSDYEAVISTLPSTTADAQQIDVKWYEKKDPAGYVHYESGNNLFTALVSPNGRTSVQDSNGRLFVWNPVLYVGTQFLTCGEPTILSRDPMNENYSHNVLQWTYELKTGLFGSSKVTILRQLRLIEGSILEYYIIDSNPQGDFIVQRREAADLGTQSSLTDAVAWDSSTYRQYLKVDNQYTGFTIPAKEFANKVYPVTIDPESTFTSSTSDGCLWHYNNYGESTSSDAWDYVHDGATAANSPYNTQATSELYISTEILSDKYYADIERAFLYFDTSGVPDESTITSAVLRLYGMASSVTELGAWTMIVQSGMPTYPHDPLLANDYYYSYYSGNGGTLSSSSMGSGYKEINLNSTGLSWIDKTTTTKFTLRDLTYDVNNTIPPFSADWAINEWIFYASEQGTGYAPKLVVTYTAPITPPTVSTIEALNIDETSMTLKGYLSDDGGESCSVKFEYGTDTTYGYSSATLSGKVTGDYFNIGIYGLSRGTTYHFRAVATNTAGTSNGLDETATTLPAVPTSFTATAGNQQNVLAWTKGSGANKTMVRFSTTGYPSSISDGTQVYFDTGTGTTHTSLTQGTTYYYSAWSEVSEQYSTSYATASATPYYTGAPDVTTRDTTAIGTSSATLNGYLDALNQSSGTVSCTLQYYYGGGSWADNETIADTLSAPGSFGEAVTGLQASTLYHVRAKAVGTNGTGYGDDVTFTTGANSAPTMTTQAATGTGLTYTTVNGKITADGGLDVTAWFIWGLSETNLDQTTGTATGLQTDDVYNCSLTGLDPDTTYYFQAVGQNTAGIGYGSTLNFTTSAPSAPTVTTNEASDVGANQSTLSGTVTGDGGVECEVQFEWDTDTGEPYANSTGWQTGYHSGDTFTALISGLTVGQDYYFRASVKNSNTTAYGTEKTFTTVFVAPTNFTAKTTGATTISLSWTKQGDQTYIVYKTSGYPVDRLDGEQAYFGDASSATHDGLIPGITYFYRAWSWRSGDVWSGTYAEDAATTLPVKTSEEKETPTIQPTPVFPSEMYTTPSTDKLSNIPGHEMIDSAADELDMPRGMFWLMISMGFLLALGLMLYIPTGSAILAAIVVGLGMVVLSAIGIMPWWIIVVFIILALGMFKVFNPGGAQ